MVAVGAVATVALASPDAPERPAHSPVRHVSGIEPDGLLVLGVLSPERAMVADPRTGTTSERRLAGGTLCHGPLLAVGDRVVFSGSRGRRPIARSLPLSLNGPGRSLGPADTFLASATAGRVWLAEFGRKAARVTLREVTVTGRPVAHAIRPIRRQAWPAGVVDGGFLLSHGRGLSLRRDAAPPRRFRDAWLVATGGSRFAWCRGSCRRIELSTADTDRTLAPPAGVRPQIGEGAAFSPDRQRLALVVRTGVRDRIAVIDLASGEWRVLPGARPARYGPIAWSPSGRWLYFTGSRHRVLGWRTGAGRPIPLPIDTGGTVMSIATTAALLR
jgi:hypothetical protein